MSILAVEELPALGEFSRNADLHRPQVAVPHRNRRPLEHLDGPWRNLGGEHRLMADQTCVAGDPDRQASRTAKIGKEQLPDVSLWAEHAPANPPAGPGIETWLLASS